MNIEEKKQALVTYCASQSFDDCMKQCLFHATKTSACRLFNFNFNHPVPEKAAKAVEHDYNMLVEKGLISND